MKAHLIESECAPLNRIRHDRQENKERKDRRNKGNACDMTGGNRLLELSGSAGITAQTRCWCRNQEVALWKVCRTPCGFVQINQILHFKSQWTLHLLFMKHNVTLEPCCGRPDCGETKESGRIGLWLINKHLFALLFHGTDWAETMKANP